VVQLGYEAVHLLTRVHTVVEEVAELTEELLVQVTLLMQLEEHTAAEAVAQTTISIQVGQEVWALYVLYGVLTAHSHQQTLVIYNEY
jgi:hypothetical protein